MVLVSTDNPAYADDNMPSHTADYVRRYRSFEEAVLALASFMCPQEVHCDRCRNKAADHLHNLIDTLPPNGRSGA